MFERFTQSARRTVEFAADEVRTLGHGHLGTEHLLLGLLHQPEEPAVAVLVRQGLDLPTARAAALRILQRQNGQPGGDPASGDGDGDGSALDSAALESIGIDLDAVTERVEAAFGAGALDRPGAGPGSAAGAGRVRTRGRIAFTRRAKKVMELSLRAARGRGDSHLGAGHLLLGLLREGGGAAVVVLREYGLDLAEVERAVEREMGPAGS